MSITINPNVNLNPTNFLPLGLVSNTVNAGVNAAQSGIMQQLSQLFSMLSQLFGSGLQNSQFNTNPLSSALGNTLGNSLNNGLGNLPLSGLQNAQFGGSPISISLGNGNGQSFTPALQNPQLGGGGPITITINNPGTPASIGTDRSIGTGSFQPQQPMNTERAAQVLNQNFDRLSGGAETFNRSDLQRVANDPSSPSELRQAARFVLNNPQAMSALDTADKRCSAGADGRISLGDLTAAGGAVQPQPAMSTERASQVLNQNFDKLSGGAETFGRSDLVRVANDPSSSPELRQAARAVLNDPQAMSRLDTADSRSRGGNELADGRISRGDLTAVGGAVVPMQPMTTERASQVLSQNFDKISGGSETITRDDLSRVANDPSQPTELRRAAQFLLDNPGSVIKLDNADARFRGKSEATDGRISKGDLAAGSTLSDWQ